MKRDQRLPFIAVAIAAADKGSPVCNFCKFQKGSGGGSPCMENYDVECGHPLQSINTDFFEWKMDCFVDSDCWGFRPRYSIEETADLVGLILQDYYPERWAYYAEDRPPTGEEVRVFERRMVIGEVEIWKWGANGN